MYNQSNGINENGQPVDLFNQILSRLKVVGEPDLQGNYSAVNVW